MFARLKRCFCVLLLTISAISGLEFSYTIEDEPNDNRYTSANDQCVNRVYQACNHRTHYSEEEIENARIFIQSKFAATNPVRPACKRLVVRKDFKCLTETEKYEFLNALRELYRNGVIDTLALVHSSLWPAFHKFAEALTWHRWAVNVIDLELRKVNPNVVLPYWDWSSEFANPERSIIWKYFGTSGNKANDYCVTDGAFAYQKVKYRTPHCIRRQWNEGGRMTNWEPSEWITSIMQVSQNYSQFTELLGFSNHFKAHLSIGGFYGDYSIQIANNDPVFYIFHEYLADFYFLKYQLSQDDRLIPFDYDTMTRLDVFTGQIVQAQFNSDVLTYFTEATIREIHQVGYGSLCYVHDAIIGIINNVIRNVRPELPVAVSRLAYTLPPDVFARYYPKFAANSFTELDYDLPDVGDCPSNPQNCRLIPTSPLYNSTANGRRNLERFRFDAGVNELPLALQTETLYLEYMGFLRSYGYCSPYVL